MHEGIINEVCANVLLVSVFNEGISIIPYCPVMSHSTQKGEFSGQGTQRSLNIAAGIVLFNFGEAAQKMFCAVRYKIAVRLTKTMPIIVSVRLRSVILSPPLTFYFSLPHF